MALIFAFITIYSHIQSSATALEARKRRYFVKNVANVTSIQQQRMRIMHKLCEALLFPLFFRRSFSFLILYGILKR